MPEQFALVGPGKRKPARRGPSAEALDSVGEMQLQPLFGRRPESIEPGAKRLEEAFKIGMR